MSVRLVEKKAQMDHEEDAPKLAEGHNENVTNMNSTEDSEDDSCMEVHGDEEWVKKYGDIVWSSEDVTMTPDGGDHMNEGEDMSDHVVIRHEGMTQWSCQMIANGPDSDID